jgi:hypothetical protein
VVAAATAFANPPPTTLMGKLQAGGTLTTGLGVADDLKSLMTFTDPSAIGNAGQAIIIKAPLCEDM